MSELLRPKNGLWRRRDVLAMGSVAASAALLPDFAGAAGRLETTESLSVGYLEGSDRLDDVFRLPWRDVAPIDREEQLVVPADSLLSGDSSMAYSLLRIKLHGIYPAMPPRRAAMPGGIYLQIACDYPWLGLGKPLPFYPWGARFGAHPTCGSPTCFTVPTRADGSLAMAFDIVPSSFGKGALARRAETDFTVDPWAGRPKLQRGIYLLALGTQAFSREQVIPADPTTRSWELCSLVMSVDHLEDGAI